MKNIIIGTSCYKNCNSGNTVSITGDGGNAWGYFGPSYKKLVPSLKLYEYYRDNPDNLSEIELIEYYIKEFYSHRLKTLKVNELLYILKEKYGRNIILLCHELPSNSNIISKKHFCHRRIIADYIELTSGIKIPEIILKEKRLELVEQPDYKKLIKKLI